MAWGLYVNEPKSYSRWRGYRFLPVNFIPSNAGFAAKEVNRQTAFQHCLHGCWVTGRVGGGHTRPLNIAPLALLQYRIRGALDQLRRDNGCCWLLSCSVHYNVYWGIKRTGKNGYTRTRRKLYPRVQVDPQSPTQYLWTSGICRCWPYCLELFARGHAGSGCFWGQLQAVTEDVLICTVLVCSAH